MTHQPHQDCTARPQQAFKQAVTPSIPHLVVDNTYPPISIEDDTKAIADMTDHHQTPVVIITDSHARYFGERHDDYRACFDNVALVFESHDGEKAFFAATGLDTWYIRQNQIGVLDGEDCDDADGTDNAHKNFDMAIILGDLGHGYKSYFDSYKKDGGMVYQSTPDNHQDFNFDKFAMRMRDTDLKRPHKPAAFTLF